MLEFYQCYATCLLCRVFVAEATIPQNAMLNAELRYPNAFDAALPYPIAPQNQFSDWLIQPGVSVCSVLHF
jgi:hypothetical protein